MCCMLISLKLVTVYHTRRCFFRLRDQVKQEETAANEGNNRSCRARSCRGARMQNLQLQNS